MIKRFAYAFALVHTGRYGYMYMLGDGLDYIEYVSLAPARIWVSAIRFFLEKTSESVRERDFVGVGVCVCVVCIYILVFGKWVKCEILCCGWRFTCARESYQPCNLITVCNLIKQCGLK